jgi:hypothetical protein
MRLSRLLLTAKNLCCANAYTRNSTTNNVTIVWRLVQGAPHHTALARHDKPECMSGQRISASISAHLKNRSQLGPSRQGNLGKNVAIQFIADAQYMRPAEYEEPGHSARISQPLDLG